MAKRPKNDQGIGTDPGQAGGGDGPPPGTTGRYLVLLPDSDRGGAALLKASAGLSVAVSSDFGGDGGSEEAFERGDGLLLSSIGVAVVNGDPDQVQALSSAATEQFLTVEPERVVYALGGRTVLDTAAGDYLEGYRDAVNHLFEQLAAGAEDTRGRLVESADNGSSTWGLQATGVINSQLGGRGVGVAVLDTGFDLKHPDYIGRLVNSRSFIPGEAVQDGHGHGTHCIGTACGPARPGAGPRYGVACDADIFVGKVLSNRGSGVDGGILQGIQWAIENRCVVISMSLGSAVAVGQGHSNVYEQVARRALAAGSLIIAAAGNESSRPQRISPVGHPANCPSIMAISAVDSRMQVASFSCGGLNGQGGQVDLAGPGVDVLSSWPRPQNYRSISGTSMATPHVAGIAALFAQSDSSYRGRALMSILTQSARRLPISAQDVGSGLVQAP